ncbi:hypothetical protein CL654_01500 [bacterium]|nr:hypothetical protein [bacterium]|tara:strand:+ start:11481 stop:11672 length:192 start_codon:yes stop_codon:yes gene_type:complete
MEKKGVTVKIAAEVLGVSVNTLRKWDKEGVLKAQRKDNGYRYYHIRELEKFAKTHKLRRKKRL